MDRTKWDPSTRSAAVVRDGVVVERHGETADARPVASITKLVTATAVLVAVEEGTVDLGDPAGPPGSTVAHLLAHTSGLAFDGDALVDQPGRRRIYSNTGYELLGAHLEERSGLSAATYVTEAVLTPLHMERSRLTGSVAAGLEASVDDLVRLIGEFRRPSLLDPDTARRFSDVAFPGVAGVVPGWGRHDPCDWGLGPEIRGTKEPHWMGQRCSPATYGHFGGSGTYLWFDPLADVGCVVFADREFGEWATTVWPVQSDGIWSAGSAS